MSYLRKMATSFRRITACGEGCGTEFKLTRTSIALQHLFLRSVAHPWGPLTAATNSCHSCPASLQIITGFVHGHKLGVHRMAWLFLSLSGSMIDSIGGLSTTIISVSVSLWVLTGFVMWQRQQRHRSGSLPGYAKTLHHWPRLPENYLHECSPELRATAAWAPRVLRRAPRA